MASKFMANAAFKARLLLRPSHQRTVWTVIPGRPTLPPILSSRLYSGSTSTPTPPFPESSGSTSTPPFPKSSGSTSAPPFPKPSSSTEGSQSSGPEDKNWSHSKTWGKVWGWAKAQATALSLGSIGGGIILYATQSIWLDWYQTYQRCARESARESAVYDKLKKGPVFRETIQDIIPRAPLVEKIRQLITPAEESRPYPVIIGEHGTGKTSLIKLTVNGMDEPKGVVYADMDDAETGATQVMQEALEWRPDQLLDFDKSTSMHDILRLFSHLAIKYQQEYGKVPVLIIDNANKLAQKQMPLLDQLQDYAKSATDNGIVTVVFVTSEGRVPRRMMERSSWSGHGRVIEIPDVSKEEALEYLNHRKVDEQQAAQIHELVGGRMIHLSTIADGIKKKRTFEDIRREMYSDAQSQLDSAQVLSGLSYHEEGAKIIRELLKKGSISEKAYYSLVGRVTGTKLLETNVFAFHYNSREITFQSTVMQRYCEENSALFRARTWLDW